jgi:mono/diheme cytochrome c family protein
MSRIMLVIAAAAAASALASAASAQVKPAASAADIAQGEKTFVSHGCYQCHGYGGWGGESAGPTLANTKLSYPAFLHQLRQPRSDMPPYEAPILSDALAADVYAYLKSRPVSKPASSYPLLMGMGVK